MKKEIRKVLVVNSGSSSLKYQLFDMKTETRLANEMVEICSDMLPPLSKLEVGASYSMS